jgi:hypothetical protein
MDFIELVMMNSPGLDVLSGPRRRRLALHRKMAAKGESYRDPKKDLSGRFSVTFTHYEHRHE